MNKSVIIILTVVFCMNINNLSPIPIFYSRNIDDLHINLLHWWIGISLTKLSFYNKICKWIEINSKFGRRRCNRHKSQHCKGDVFSKHKIHVGNRSVGPCPRERSLDTGVASHVATSCHKSPHDLPALWSTLELWYDIMEWVPNKCHANYNLNCFGNMWVNHVLAQHIAENGI